MTMRRLAPFAVLLALAMGLAALGWIVTRRPENLSADVVGFLSDSSGSAGYATVNGPEPVVFPAAFGPHPDYQTEWWYYTGNLVQADGEAASGSGAASARYGYQLTFFRRAAAPPTRRAAGRTSRWAADQIYLAHFATTDVNAGKHDSAERLTRGAAGLAGATADPFRVWLEGWSAEGLSPQRSAGDWQTPVRLVAAEGDMALDLVLTPVKAPVLHGDRGYSRKGDAPGSASMYYSYSRLRTTGRITTATGSATVNGWSWMDHEWSTSALSANQSGWDWFALQLDDGTELMLFQLREKDGGISDSSSGTLVEAEAKDTIDSNASAVPALSHPDERARTDLHLARPDFTVQPTGETWTSPVTGARYPAGWRISVPKAELALEVKPVVADQELDVAFKYWEGAVRIRGSRHGRPLGGVGYVELTGYAPARSGGGLPGLP